MAFHEGIRAKEWDLVQDLREQLSTSEQRVQTLADVSKPDENPKEALSPRNPVALEHWSPRNLES
eukprot:8575953-Pyramimonas_sp.AAC.1